MELTAVLLLSLACVSAHGQCLLKSEELQVRYPCPTTVCELYEALNTTDGTLTDVFTRLDQVNNRLDDDERRLNETEAHLDQVQTQVKVLDIRVDVAEQRLDKLEANLQQTDAKVEDLDSRLNKTQGEVQELIRREKTVVAFSVKFSLDSSDSTEIITNIGGGFNESTGHFVAPVAGLYNFNFFFRGNANDEVFLLRNDNTVVKAKVAGLGGNGGNAVILQMAPGDHVTLTTNVANTEAASIQGYNTYNGFLISED